MTIPTTNVFNLPAKPASNAGSADSIEFTSSAYSLSGKAVRRLTYAIYIILMIASGSLLYMCPSQTTLLVFLALHAMMILSLYFLIRLVIASQNADIVFSWSGPRWESQENIQPPLGFNSKSRNSNGTIGRDYMNYAFI